jgi:hypothetical protein
MTDQDAAAAIVAQIADQREKIGRLDARQQINFDTLSERLTAAERLVRDTARDSAPLAARVHAVEELAATLAGKLAEVIPQDGPARAYKPTPTPQVWRLDEHSRERLVRKLSAWVRDIYKPLYGHLASRLPACWPEHDLCLVLLDVMSELQLYYTLNKRTPGILAAQGEYCARLLPALADLVAAETRNCPAGHKPAAVNGVPVPAKGGRPA